MAPKRILKTIERSCENPSCGRSFATKVRPDGTTAVGHPDRYCSVACSRLSDNRDRSLAKQSEWLQSEKSLCPCGGRIAYEDRNIRKYCSEACTKRFRKKRQRDPERYVTFNCERCGVEVTRYKKYGNGALRFCSNECSARSNTQRRIGVDDVVLDSGWEALLWGLCSFRKVPIVRFDREGVIPHGDGFYGPDFIVAGIPVEVKGLEDDDDRGRYDAWRAAGHRLVVLDRQRLEALLTSADLVASLSAWLTSDPLDT